MNTPVDPQGVTLQPRDVSWDWSGLPKYYVNGDGFTTASSSYLRMRVVQAM